MSVQDLVVTKLGSTKSGLIFAIIWCGRILRITAQKWKFLLRISSVNMNKSPVFCG